ncbi:MULTISPECIES: type II secretion system minor pseudopilin GspJ [Psychrobacter]|jgi:general secretion pathway protein J|uniref:type II secretion system minor pseudopilin GspJ n=1 Tax=Psychrobacter TaxID=497 RepID=UPI000C7DB56A|nr:MULTISPECIES: type II secretion system minor pseudopilin GspJ [Psychrobacter]PKG84604.1 type II secretion system protein GspJ [Psychrobacter sp. Sarcosine-02u-2]
MKSNHGFTLLELMVAMAIFAMLAVAGWKVFDGVNRARERAQFHADNLAVLQYAYLQLQQDMNQMIPYQAVDTQGANSSINNASSNNAATNNTNNSNQENAPAPEPFMSLDAERISFMRFADPDPRYQSSASVQHIEYIFADERLIRRQYNSLAGGSDSISLDSVLLEGVTAGRWQAYLPELSAKFPNKDSSSNNSTSNNTVSGQLANSANKTSETILLPKGIALNFTYQDMPITWQWALTPQPIPNISTNTSHKNTPNNPNANSGDKNNNGTNNDNAANGNVENNKSGNATENAPFGQ